MFPASLFSSPRLSWAPESPICHLPESSQARCPRSLRTWGGRRSWWGLGPSPRVPGPPCLRLPLDLGSLCRFLCSPLMPLSLSLATSQGSRWSLSLFLSRAVSLTLSAFHTSSLWGLLHLRVCFGPLHQVGVEDPHVEASPRAPG